MTDILENIPDFVNKSILNEYLNFHVIIDKLKKKYDIEILTQSDTLFVKETYNNVCIQLWEDECKSLLIEKIEEHKNDIRKLKQILSELRRMKFLDTDINILNNKWYQLMQQNKAHFEENSLEPVCEYLIALFKSKTDDSQGELSKFTLLLLDIIETSGWETHQKLVDVLQLKRYVRNEIPLSEVLNLILVNDYYTEDYNDLKKLSQELLKNDKYTLMEKEVNSGIKPHTEDLKAEVNIENGKENLKISGEIIFFEEIYSKYRANKVYNIQINCKTLHMHKLNNEKEYKFDLENLSIHAEFIKIHSEIILNLSGENGKEHSSLDAGTDDDGNGLNGLDGFAGKNGGNCFIRSSKIQNSKWLTIISNGGNGSNGQNGGNGKDGKNGKDVQISDFSFHGNEFKVNYWISKFYKSQIIYETENDIHKSMLTQIHAGGVFVFNVFELLLCKGSNGEKGKLGGLGSFGGEGGFSGDIKIEILVHSINNEAKNGKSGKNGIAGFNGLNGKDGRDAWAYDYKYGSSATYFGLDSFNKYEITYTNDNLDHSIWIRERKMYAYAHLIGSVKSVSSNRMRNDQKENKRSRMDHAKAEKKNNILERKEMSTKMKNNSSIKINLSVNPKKIGTNNEIPTISSFNEALSILSKKPLAFEEYVEILKSCELSSNDYSELKKLLGTKISIENVEVEAIHALTQKSNLNEYCEIYNDTSKEICKGIQVQKITKMTTLEKQIPYLYDTNQISLDISVQQEIDGNFEKMSHYFTADTETNRSQIKSLFVKAKQQKESNEGLLHKMFHYLTTDNNKVKAKQQKESYEGLLHKIMKILFEYKDEIEIFDAINPLDEEFLNFEASPENNKSFIKKFYENEKISEFIEKNLIEQGISSPIYKQIVAFAFNRNINFFCKNINGNICCIGQYNTESQLETINFLLQDKKYTELKFDEEKYKLTERRRFISQQIEKKVKTHKSADKVDWSLLLKNDREDPSIAIDKILSYFSDAIDNDEANDVKMALKNIANLDDGWKVLNAISTKMMYERNELTFNQFNFLVLSVEQMMCENSFMSTYFGYKLLALKTSNWVVEFILLHIENYLKNINYDTLQKWNKNLSKIPSQKILFLFLNKIEQLEIDEMNFSDFNAVIENMKYFVDSTYNQLIDLQDLNDWKDVVTNKYWIQNYPFIKNESAIVMDLLSKFNSENVKQLLEIMKENSSELKHLNLNEFLRNFNSGEWIFGPVLLDTLKENRVVDWNKAIKANYDVKGNQRSLEKIRGLIESNEDTSENIKVNASSNSQFANAVIASKNSFSSYSEEDIKKWLKDLHSKDDTEKLAMISHAFKKTTGFDLRYTQLMSIATMYTNNRGTLIQVSTGEGKTFIGIAFAILKCLKNKKVHIVTSSKVLAERDATDKFNNKIFGMFNLKIGHNCNEDTDERQKIYSKCDVVYGALNDFQRDYLLTEFHDENLISKESLKDITVLVDEVDSILLDRGNNILYLSQELPAVDELESIFSFIWEWVNMPISNLEEKKETLKIENARKAVLENWRGVVDVDDITKIMGVESNVKSSKIIDEIKKEGFIDVDCAFIVSKMSENEIRKAISSLQLPDSLVNNLTYYIVKCFNSYKPIKLPSFLNSFIMRHLDKWISSAISALIMENGREYVIDLIRDGTIDSEPNIIIMDTDTGTDLKNSEWDEGLCQFLQLKHGCKLSLYSLKSIFISNVSYFKLYSQIYGMTGTLGSLEERKKLTDFYNLDYVTIPTFLPKKFVEYETKISNSSDKWLNDIVNEVKDIFEKERSVLIICNTIKDIQTVQKAFQTDGTIAKENIHIYQRDYEKFDLGKLEPRKLIIATNLAGRGTDIKLSNALAVNGGLHVILSYLAPNVRVENQAFGRASRAGAKGSARIIIFKNGRNNNVNTLKNERNENEITRLNEVSAYYKNFIITEESLFADFIEDYRKFSEDIQEHAVYYFGDNYRTANEELKKILTDNLKILWTFWLDENSELMKSVKNIDKIKKNSFGKTVIESSKNKIDLHPITRIKLAQYFDKKKDFGKAKDILQIELNDGVLVQKDWNPLNYMSIYILLKIKSYEDSYNKRSLKNNETINLRKTINRLIEEDINLESRSKMVKLTKENYKVTLRPIKGYENQINKIIDAKQIFINSIKQLLGKGIVPESFHCKPFGNSIVNLEFYEHLLEKGYISYPTISNLIDKDDVTSIAKNFKINPDLLLKFLNYKKGHEIKSIDDFAENLKSSIQFPSREDFWDNLKEKGYLTNEIEYAIIDYKEIKEYNPLVAENLHKALQCYLVKDLSTENENKIFLFNHETSEKSENEENPVLLVNLNHDVRNNKNYKEMVKRKLVKINKRAQFNIEKYFKKEIFYFDKFDSISKEDFKDFPNEIFSNLLTNQILVHSNSIYRLNYEKLCEGFELGGNFIYENDLTDLIMSKFAYRLAFEDLAFKVNENLTNQKNSSDEIIKLHLHPHLMIQQDFLAKFIIEPSKVNQNMISNLEEDDYLNAFIKTEKITAYFKHNLMLNYSDAKQLIEELKTSKNLFQLNTTDFENFKESSANNIKFYYDRISKMNFNLSDCVYIKEGKIKLSNKFKNYESFVQTLLDRRRLMGTNMDSIIQTMKDAVDSLNNEIYESPTPVLVPISQFHLSVDILNFIELKGFIYVIQVQEKPYTLKYFLNIIAVFAIGLAQIAIGVCITLFSKGLAVNFGSSLISEGIGDIIFALTTLTTGTFRWGDYVKHKILSVTITILTFGISALLSKIKCLSKFFGSAKSLGDQFGKGFAGMSGWQMIKAGGEVGKQAKSYLLKESLKQIGKSSIKAVSTAGVNYVVDITVTNLLDGLMQNIAKKSSELLRGNFEEHEISKTIDLLLLEKSELEVREIVINKFMKIMDINETFRKTMTEIGDIVDRTISSGYGVSQTVNTLLSLSVKGIAIFSMGYDIKTVFNDLNNELKKEMNPEKKFKSNQDNINEATNKIQEFKKRILIEIDEILSQNLKIVLNQNVVTPILKFATNKAINMTAKTFMHEMHNLKEKKIAKKAAILASRIKSIENSNEMEANQRENIIKKITKIKATSTNPEIIAMLSKLDTPVVDAEIEAVAVTLGKKIIIENNGIKHTFGKSGEVIDLDLESEHFPNSTDKNGGVITQECFFNALKDKGKMDKPIHEFKNDVSNTILTNKGIHALIQNPHRKFFYRIGFYGGGAIKKKNIANEPLHPIRIPPIPEGDILPINTILNVENKKSIVELQLHPYYDQIANQERMPLDKIDNLIHKHAIRQNDAIKKTFIELNKEFKKVDPSWKDLTLNDFEGAKFMLAQHIYTDENSYIPTEFQLKQDALTNISKKLPELKNISMNVDDPNQQFANGKPNNGPQDQHIGMELTFLNNKTKLTHTLYKDEFKESRNDWTTTKGNEALFPITRKKGSQIHDLTLNEIEHNNIPILSPHNAYFDACLYHMPGQSPNIYEMKKRYM